MNKMNRKQNLWEVKKIMQFRGIILTHDGGTAKEHFALYRWPDYFRSGKNDAVKKFKTADAAKKFAAKNNLPIADT